MHSLFVLRMRALDDVLELFNVSLNARSVDGYKFLRAELNKDGGKKLAIRYIPNDFIEYRESLKRDQISIDLLAGLRETFGCKEILGQNNINRINAFNEVYQGIMALMH